MSHIWRLLFAMLVGGAIGLEREFKGKPAGMRTNMMMCLGSCLIMILSVEVARAAGPPADPGRIAAQVVTGIGFLGAGTIIRSRVSITGLTTAATLWFVAALGLVIGGGYFVLAGAGTLFMFLILTSLDWVEHALSTNRQLHIVRLEVVAEEGKLAAVREVLARARVTPDEVKIAHHGDAYNVNLEFVSKEKKYVNLIAKLEPLEGVRIVLKY